MKDLFRLCPPPHPVHYASPLPPHPPPVTKHVPLHGKLFCKNMTRASGGDVVNNMHPLSLLCNGKGP